MGVLRNEQSLSKSRFYVYLNRFDQEKNDNSFELKGTLLTGFSMSRNQSSCSVHEIRGSKVQSLQGECDSKIFNQIEVIQFLI